MLSISLQSHLIRHSGTGRTFKHTQRALRKHSGTCELRGHWALVYLESNRRALGHLWHLGIQTLNGTQALGHLRHSGTWPLELLGT